MIRLVAFDLDGTVLSETGEISQASLEAIRALWKAGIFLASISGRNVEKSQAPFAGDPELAAALFVGSYNGAIVLDSGVSGSRTLLHEERLPADGFSDVMAFVAARGLNFIYCQCEVVEGGVKEIYMTDRETESVRTLGKMTGMQFGIYADLLSRAAALGSPPKMILMPGAEQRDTVLEEMQKAFGERFYLARTGNDRIEVMHPEVNKAVALAAICKLCEVPISQALAIGDGDNDLPMLRAAGTGVLLENADEQTRKLGLDAGLEMAPSFEVDGFAWAVERFVLS
ncbi:MAG: HAD hydrolase family protein [bacterium]|nr:HAD hydrolase family protein [bacterium]